MLAAANTTIDYIAAWATFGTAIGTVGLAVATFVLALKTRALAKSGEQTARAAERELELLRDQADAAKRQSEAAEAALNASVRPMLLDVPLGTFREVPTTKGAITSLDVSKIHKGPPDRPERLTVPVRNVGAGIARVLAAVVVGTTEGAPEVRGKVPAVIAPGEVGYLAFFDTDGELHSLLASDELLQVEVAYSDLAGRQEAATLLNLEKIDQEDRAYRPAGALPGRDLKFTKQLRAQSAAP